MLNVNLLILKHVSFPPVSQQITRPVGVKEEEKKFLNLSLPLDPRLVLVHRPCSFFFFRFVVVSL